MSPRRADPKAKAQSGGLPTWVIAVGVGVVVVVAAVVLFTLQSPSTGLPPATVGSTLSSTSRTMGDPNAKLELIEFSDFQ